MSPDPANIPRRKARHSTWPCTSFGSILSVIISRSPPRSIRINKEYSPRGVQNVELIGIERASSIADEIACMELIHHLPNEDISWRILVGTIVSIVPATICVVLRFIARHVAHAGLWWDDYTIAAALVCNWAMDALRWAQIPLYGYGHHAQYVPADKLRGFRKTFVVVQLLYITNAVITKASLLFLYYRIFGVVKSYRWALLVSGFLVAGYFIACTIVTIAGCLPVSKIWDVDQPGHCINQVAFFRWNGVGNMFLDFLVLCLPFPMAWRVNTTTRQKWILTGIFLLGSFVCIVSILRIISFRSAKLDDPAYYSIGPAAWSSVEQSVGIICACLPTLRPLFRWLYDSSRSSSGDSLACDSQSQCSIPDRMSSPYYEESSIVGFAPSSLQRHKRRASSHQLDRLQSDYRSPSFDETQGRLDSQASRTNGLNGAVSPAEPFA